MEKIGELFGVPVVVHDGDIPSVILMKQSDAFALMAVVLGSQRTYPATAAQQALHETCPTCLGCGNDPMYKGVGDCPTCKGTGKLSQCAEPLCESCSRYKTDFGECALILPKVQACANYINYTSTSA